MSLIGAIIGLTVVGGVIKVAMGSNDNKTTDSNDQNQLDIPSLPNQTIPPIPGSPIPDPPKIPEPEYVGKYPYSVEVDNRNIGRFNAKTTANQLYDATRKSNVTALKSIVAKLNKDQIRAIHNTILDASKGKKTLYQLIMSSGLSSQAKAFAGQYLASAGVSKTLVKTRSKL